MIDKAHFRMILSDLIEENPLACQGILAIAGLEFTTSVETLAVTLNTERPLLRVNGEFIAKHCREEVDVKAVLLHEFLHVLLNHTGHYDVADQATNLALDAVINHIIHRSCGAEYSEFFRSYYGQASGWAALLVPAASLEQLWEGCPDEPLEEDDERDEIRLALYEGRLLADDILDLMRDTGAAPPGSEKTKSFLGNHDPELQGGGLEDSLSPLVVDALDETFRRLNGNGIFRDPGKAGCAGADPYSDEWEAQEQKRNRWDKLTWELLRSLLTPDPKSRAVEFDVQRSTLPVLNSSDRRGFVRSLWSPIIPDILWDLPFERPLGTAQVYLDVSGSMHFEMQALVGLLHRLRRWVRSPFWAFSNEVAPAVIEGGVLKTKTSGGTSMNCVLRHIAETRPDKVLIVTDGYIETCDEQLLRRVRDQGLHVIVSRQGNTQKLEQAGLPWTRLCEYPGEHGEN